VKRANQQFELSNSDRSN